MFANEIVYEECLSCGAFGCFGECYWQAAKDQEQFVTVEMAQQEMEQC